MAKRIETILVDDLDGSTVAVETVRFGIDGTDYEIDLNSRHAAALRSALNVYVGAARRASRRKLKAG